MWIDLAIGLLLGGAIVVLGYRGQVFALGGAFVGLASVLAVLALRDWTWAAPLLIVLAGVVWLGVFRADYKRNRLDAARALRLSWEQMVSRLGWALLMAVLSRLLGTHDSYYLAFLGALAVALGRLDRQRAGVALGRAAATDHLRSCEQSRVGGRYLGAGHDSGSGRGLADRVGRSGGGHGDGPGWVGKTCRANISGCR